MQLFLKKILYLISIFLLFACESKISTPQYAMISFAHISPIYFDVAEIIIRNDYQKNAKKSNDIENQLPISLSQIANSWADNRLIANGDNGQLIFIIKNASIVEKNLKKTTGLAGILTIDQAQQYNAHIAIELIVEKNIASQKKQAKTTIEVRHSQSVNEKITLNQRSQIWYQMVDKIGIDMDRILDKNIKIYLKDFILK